jgi:hypothetical protein
MMNPRKIEILLLEGIPFGLRYVDLKGTTLRAFIAPHNSFDKLLKRPEMGGAGVYVLYGEPPEKNLPLVYVGEADILGERLPAHRSKDFWTEIIVFTAQDETLDKAGVRYIESILVERIQRDKLVDVENDAKPRIKTLSEANVAVMNDFIEDIIVQLLVLGYKILRSSYVGVEQSEPELHISKDVISARGRNTDEGFIVYANSTARKELLTSASPTVAKTQKALIERAILKDLGTHLAFTQDYLFSSSSLAASLILGRSSNGLIEWKNRENKTLKQLQEN